MTSKPTRKLKVTTPKPVAEFKQVTFSGSNGLQQARGAAPLTKIGIHAMNQLYKDPKQMTLFSDEKVDEFVKKTGLSLNKRPKSFGMELNQVQLKVFEGILKAFSDTQYNGSEQITKAQYREETGVQVHKMPEAYANLDKIPVIEVTQAQLIKLAGYEKRQGDKVDVLNAFAYLATNQFYFYWRRLAKDKGTKAPYKKENGDYAMEGVEEIGTLLRVQITRDEKSGEIKLYRISPSPVMIDHVTQQYGGQHFLLLPAGWQKQVLEVTGKRASPYTYTFLLWLRLQFEKIRRQNNSIQRENEIIRQQTANPAKTNKKGIKVRRSGYTKAEKPFILHKTWEEVAETLKMPETMYIKNRKRAAIIIQKCYEVAIRLGYLLRVDKDGAGDILYLNSEFYPTPGQLQ